tara:strand:+ start:619 stop:1281 length:663 start_codon:yes stop_codon:yes gene_type:complete
MENNIKIHTKLVALTQPVSDISASNAEEFIAYAARVSSPSNQNNHDTAQGLLSYCMRNKHWSVFEMANAIVEVNAPRDITRQLLRHRSFSFQEFSQRYSDDVYFTERDFRSQDTKNRQNSVDDLSETIQQDAWEDISVITEVAFETYRSMIKDGIAKECARVVLPEGLTMSKLYVNGTLRSWLHYLDVRDDEGVTQLEHVLLARAIKDTLKPAFPKIFSM